MHVKIYCSYLFFIVPTSVANEETSFSMCGISGLPVNTSPLQKKKKEEKTCIKNNIYIKKLVSSFQRITSENALEAIKVVKELQLTNQNVS